MFELWSPIAPIQRNGFVARIVIEPPSIDKRLVGAAEILDAKGKATADGDFRYIVTALLDAGFYPCDSSFR